MKMGVFAATSGTQAPIIQALARIGAERKNQAAALKLLRIRRSVEQAAKDFEEARTALIQQHGTGDEEGGYTVPQEALPMFIADFRDLCAQDVPASMLAETIALADLWTRGADGERIEIELAENDMDALGELLVIKVEQPAPKRKSRAKARAR